MLNPKDSSASDVALPSPPFINIAGVPNFRDLGGHKIDSRYLPAKTVRRGLIYRCAEPSAIREDGVKKIGELRVAKAYDLRSLPEIRRATNAGYGAETEWQGCKRCLVPVFQEREYDPGRVALSFRNYAAEGTEVRFESRLKSIRNGWMSCHVFW